jgi:spore coat protein U-like protein
VKPRLESLLRSSGLFALAFALSLMLTGSAHAAISCTIPTGVSLNFGTYDDSSSAPLNVATSFSVSCCQTGGGSGMLTVALGTSLNSGQVNTRQMKNMANSDVMSYQLYSGSFGGTVWGDGVSGGSAFTQTVSVTPTCASGTRQNIVLGSSIFGQVSALQSVSAGNYTDQVTITVTP